MERVWFSLVAEQVFPSALVFGLVWLVLRRRPGGRLVLPRYWPTAGVLLTALVSGSLRMLSYQVVGGAAVMDPQGGLQLVYGLVLPALVATALLVCTRRRLLSHELARKPV